MSEMNSNESTNLVLSGSAVTVTEEVETETHQPNNDKFTEVLEEPSSELSESDKPNSSSSSASKEITSESSDEDPIPNPNDETIEIVDSLGFVNI
jgi:hypothetical protein